MTPDRNDLRRHSRVRGNRPSVSVVIPALNAAATIEVQLRALAAQEYDGDWEVIVVDNGSTDSTTELCAEMAASLPSLRVVRCLTPGTSAARNRGVAVSRGEHLLFCDADDEVAPGWITALSGALDSSGAAGGAIENDKLNDHLLPLPRHPDHLPVVAGFLPRAITANLGVRRDVFDELGGFTVDYDYGGPDTEFCWRLQLAQHELTYACDAVVHYRHRQTRQGAAVKAYRTGVSRARLFRDYGSRGMPRPRMAGVLFRWAVLVASTPTAVMSASRRWAWFESAAGAAGRIAGSWRFRVLYL